MSRSTKATLVIIIIIIIIIMIIMAIIIIWPSLILFISWDNKYQLIVNLKKIEVVSLAPICQSTWVDIYAVYKDVAAQTFA